MYTQKSIIHTHDVILHFYIYLSLTITFIFKLYSTYHVTRIHTFYSLFEVVSSFSSLLSRYNGVYKS